MNGLIIFGKTELGEKLIREDINNLSFQERLTLKALFKRRIIDSPFSVDYQLRKLYRKKFNANKDLPQSTFQEGDVINIIRDRFNQLDLIEDVDFSIEVY